MIDNKTNPKALTPLEQYKELIALREQLLKLENSIKNKSIFNLKQKHKTPPDGQDT